MDKQEPESDFKEIKRLLKDHCAFSQLETLANAGCNSERLLALLSLAFLTDESWKALTGNDLRQLKAAMKKITACATLIDDLNRSELIFRAFDLQNPRFVDVYQSPTLSDRLREYAKAIEEQMQIQGPEHKSWLDTWKAQLVAMVLEGTGREHDPELSAIIAAVLDCEYAEKAHQAWRLDHPELIEQERKRLRERHSKRISAPTANL